MYFYNIIIKGYLNEIRGTKINKSQAHKYNINNR